MKLTAQIARRCSDAIKVATDDVQRDMLNQVITLWGARLSPHDKKTVPSAMQICRDLGVEMPAFWL